MGKQINSGLDAALQAIANVTDTTVDWSDKVRLALALLNSGHTNYGLNMLPVCYGRIKAGNLIRVFPTGYCTATLDTSNINVGDYKLDFGSNTNIKAITVNGYERPNSVATKWNDDYTECNLVVLQFNSNLETIQPASDGVDFVVLEA